MDYSKTKRFDGYEIAPVHEWTSDGSLCCEAHESEAAAKSAHDGAMFSDETSRVYWSLYGRTEGEGVECIGDFNSEAATLEMLYRITGIQAQPTQARSFHTVKPWFTDLQGEVLPNGDMVAVVVSVEDIQQIVQDIYEVEITEDQAKRFIVENYEDISNALVDGWSEKLSDWCNFKEFSPDATKCDNCGLLWESAELKPIQHLTERVAPGEPMPSGECPSCGAVCNPTESEAK